MLQIPLQLNFEKQDTYIHTGVVDVIGFRGLILSVLFIIFYFAMLIFITSCLYHFFTEVTSSKMLMSLCDIFQTDYILNFWNFCHIQIMILHIQAQKAKAQQSQPSLEGFCKVRSLVLYVGWSPKNMTLFQVSTLHLCVMYFWCSLVLVNPSYISEYTYSVFINWQAVMCFDV